MTRDRLANFIGYQKAMQLWDLFWADSEILLRDIRGIVEPGDDR